MTGDQEDMEARLWLTLPGRWFEDAPPVLSGVIAGLASAWAGLFALLNVVRQQSRVATVTSGFLDLAATDFFGSRLLRRAGESDDAFRVRLLAAMKRSRATRNAVIWVAQDEGYTVAVFEPARPADTGAYSIPGNLAWGSAGGWGSLQMPLECLVTARREAGGDDTRLKVALTDSLPAGGVAWLRITD